MDPYQKAALRMLAGVTGIQVFFREETPNIQDIPYVRHRAFGRWHNPPAYVVRDLPPVALERLFEFAIAKAAALAQVDDVLVTDWIAVKDGDYRQALADLIAWNIKIENDPAASTTAKARQDEINNLRDENARLNEAVQRLSAGLGHPALKLDNRPDLALVDYVLALLKTRECKEGC